MKLNWQKGVFDFHYKREKRKCRREDCINIFEVPPHDPKVFCSQACAAFFNNKKRGKLSEETKLKIANKLKGRPNPYKGIILVPRLKIVCKMCGKVFIKERWKKREFCSTVCAGRRPTSPKAAKGKNGIRSDISPHINFYSRWEANFARILNLLNIKWEFQPQTFNLKYQKYTPDFYLPEKKLYIEIKNFLSDYSLKRHQEFKELYSLYSNEKLLPILKDDYLELQKQFSPFIKNWEFS